MPEYLIQHDELNYIVSANDREELNRKLSSRVGNSFNLQQFHKKFEVWVCLDDDVLPEEGIIKVAIPVR